MTKILNDGSMVIPGVICKQPRYLELSGLVQCYCTPYDTQSLTSISHKSCMTCQGGLPFPLSSIIFGIEERNKVLELPEKVNLLFDIEKRYKRKEEFLFHYF